MESSYRIIVRQRFDRNPYSRSYHSSKRFCHALVLPGHVIYTTCPSYSGLRTRSSSRRITLLRTPITRKRSRYVLSSLLVHEKRCRVFYYISSCIFYRIFVFYFIEVLKIQAKCVQHSSHTLSAHTIASRFYEKSGDRDDVVGCDVATSEEQCARISTRTAVNRDGGETALSFSNVIGRL